MKLVDLSIKKPVTVSVGAILLLLFGFLALLRIPIQLTPNVDLPEVSIQTTWTGASPEEVEREVTEVQEKELKSLNGLTEIKSESQDGLSYISLEFEIGTDIDEALLRVSNKMEQVKSYPDNVDRPIIKSGGRFEKAIAWMVLMAEDGYRGNLEEEYDFLDEEVQPWLERLPGISSVNIHGGKKREMQVVVDVEAMASRRITVPDLIRALRVENKTISAGDFDEGKRRYIARTVGEYQSPEDVANVIIRRVDGIPVAVKDVATVRLGHETPAVVVRHDGVTTIVMSAVREPGTNVLLVMDRLKTALAELNGGHPQRPAPVHRTGLRRDHLHLRRHQPGQEEPDGRIDPGGHGAASVSAQHRRDGGGLRRHSRQRGGHLSLHDPGRPQHQRGQPGRA